ncbi:carbohydrate esterase family 8 protein-like protein [Decorospora gaudefroyi]|uniref:Pectinesterase n=1 Tax=Decorospora gaudefroyi TaxID=184978 RepID=A0A6A5K9X8_9PLEO|nr:carbohydrate esterase family 8 protein-like protein [Decorospora gaudefroyi]
MMTAHISRFFALACAFYVVSADKYARTKPDRGAIIVDATGAHSGSYLNISAAVTALDNTNNAQKIFIFPGTYKEQVYIPSLSSPLTIQGYTDDARDYKGNQVTLTYNLSRLTPGLTNNDQTSTLRLWTANVKLYNLNIANTFGSAAVSGQALALSAQNTNQGFYGCKFTGWQDTIYANEGRQIYAKSYVSGAVDFIFGLRASAWFEKVDIATVGAGWITANGRDTEENTSFYVFNKANVMGTSGPDSTYLGRPWRPYSRVVFQKSYLGDVVRPAGWSRWDNVQSTDDVVYGEYENYGPGAQVAARANFSSQLSAPIQAVDLFGAKFKKESWVDADYL